MTYILSPKRIAPILTGLLGLALASCGSEKAAQPGNTAEGEILPGSVSDAMLPIDSVRSQPPLAPRAGPSGKPGGDDARPAGEPAADASAAPAAGAEATPAAE